MGPSLKIKAPDTTIDRSRGSYPDTPVLVKDSSDCWRPYATDWGATLYDAHPCISYLNRLITTRSATFQLVYLILVLQDNISTSLYIFINLALSFPQNQENAHMIVYDIVKPIQTTSPHAIKRRKCSNILTGSRYMEPLAIPWRTYCASKW